MISWIGRIKRRVFGVFSVIGFAKTIVWVIRRGGGKEFLIWIDGKWFGSPSIIHNVPGITCGAWSIICCSQYRRILNVICGYNVTSNCVCVLFIFGKDWSIRKTWWHWSHLFFMIIHVMFLRSIQPTETTDAPGRALPLNSPKHNQIILHLPKKGYGTFPEWKNSPCCQYWMLNDLDKLTKLKLFLFLFLNKLILKEQVSSD